MIVKPLDQNPDREYINKLSNYLFDYVMPTLKPSEWMVLCFIIRKTTGWQKESDKVSLADIVKGTGIKSATTVNEAIGKLEKHGYILVERGQSTRRVNTYTLNTALEMEITIPEIDIVEPISNEGNPEITEEAISENDISITQTISKNGIEEAETISKNGTVDPLTISKIDNTKRQYKKTDSISGENPKPAREPTEKQKKSWAMFQALVDLCQYDTGMITDELRDILNKAEKGMRDKGYQPADLEAFGVWWYENDWRGQKGQPPTLKQIRENWGRFKNTQQPKRMVLK